MGTLISPKTGSVIRDYLQKTNVPQGAMYSPYVPPIHSKRAIVPFEGVICLRCDSSVLDREECECKATALIIDEDYHFHIYTEDPTIARLATIYFSREPQLTWSAKPINRQSPRTQRSQYNYIEHSRIYGPALVTGIYVNSYKVQNTPLYRETRWDRKPKKPPFPPKSTRRRNVDPLFLALKKQEL